MLSETKIVLCNIPSRLGVGRQRQTKGNVFTHISSNPIKNSEEGFLVFSVQIWFRGKKRLSYLPKATW